MSINFLSLRSTIAYNPGNVLPSSGSIYTMSTTGLTVWQNNAINISTITASSVRVSSLSSSGSTGLDITVNDNTGMKLISTGINVYHNGTPNIFVGNSGSDNITFLRNLYNPNIQIGTSNYIGYASANDNWVSGSAVGDMIFIVNNKSIIFSTNNGSSQALSLINTGANFYYAGSNIISIGNNSPLGIGYDAITFNRPLSNPVIFCSDNMITPYIGGAGYFVPGSAVGDMVIRVKNRKILFSVDSGVSLAGSFGSNGFNTYNSGNRLQGININSPQAGLQLISTGSGGRTYNMWSSNTGEAYGGGAYVIYDQTIDAYRFAINSSGTIFLPAYTTNGTVSTTGGNGQLSASSDSRIKDNIEYVTDTQQGLNQVLQLKPATFCYKTSSDKYFGFIAQDVETVLPLAVDGKKHQYQWVVDSNNKPIVDASGNLIDKIDEEGNKVIRPRGLSQISIVAVQTLAIQELNKIIQKQQEQINKQQEQINQLLTLLNITL